MAFLSPLHVALIAIAVATYLLYVKWLRSKYPPGPWPLPIIGNLHLLSDNPYIGLTEIGKQFGPVFTVWMGWQPTVILCNLETIQEATIRKGDDFAGRSMDANGFKQIFHDNEDFLSRSYDRKMETMKKLALTIGKGKTMGGLSVQKIVEDEILRMIQLAKETKETVVNPFDLVNIPVSNTIMRAVFNFSFKNEKDAEFIKWQTAVADMKTAFDKAIIVSFFPPLWHIWRSAQNYIKKALKGYDEFIDSCLRPHEETYQEGIVRDLTDSILSYRKNMDEGDVVLTRLNVAELIKDILGAGTLTVTSAILWAFLALLRHPDVQERTQKELDRYRATSNTTKKEMERSNDIQGLLFDLADRSYLPYLNAFIHETLRRCPVAPLALPHKTMHPTSIGGYSIPNDTAVNLNVYACHMDKEIWVNPFNFNPDRFLSASGQFDHSKANRLMTFSAGPRSCVGENLARMQMFLCLSNVLYTFKLDCPSIEELPTLHEGHFRLECSPLDYKLRFKVR